MRIFIQALNDGSLIGYSSSKSSESDIEIDVPDDHEVLMKPFSFKYNNNQLVKDDSTLLQKEKGRKYTELDLLCTETILGRFKSKVDTIEYEFSYDAEAQSRFSGVASSFTRGYITEMEWTCYLNGERTSVILNESQFDVVAKNALFHEASNISKFRQKIKEIESASTISQVREITW